MPNSMTSGDGRRRSAAHRRIPALARSSAPARSPASAFSGSLPVLADTQPDGLKSARVDHDDAPVRTEALIEQGQAGEVAHPHA